MRIGIDYTSAARQRAGIGRYTRELVNALLMLDNHHRYAIFAATGRVPRERWRNETRTLMEVAGNQLTLRSIPLSDEWLVRGWHRLRLPLPVELVTGRVDVFYSPDFALPPTCRGVRTVLTVHDLSFMRHPNTFMPALRRYLEDVVPRSVARADAVLADSTHTRSDLVSLLGVSEEKVRVIKPGVDHRFRPRPRPTTRGGQCTPSSPSARLRRRYHVADAPYVLSVGTLQPRKNYVRLIQAFAQARTGRSEDLQLLIVGGPGWLYEGIIEEASQHDSVRLLGFVEDKDLLALYRGAALFAFPSIYEGFGLPVLEAMACGTPVVCSNTSSLPEIAGDAALLVNPLDVGSLSSAMKRVLEEAELRTQMIDRGLAQARRFTWAQAAQQLLDVITSWEEI